MASGVYAKIWWSEPMSAEDLAKWPSAREHPGGYVVEVYAPTGASQWDLGVKTLEEAKAFARSLGAVTIHGAENLPTSWAGRDDGDEITRGEEALLAAERRSRA